MTQGVREAVRELTKVSIRRGSSGPWLLQELGCRGVGKLCQMQPELGSVGMVAGPGVNLRAISRSGVPRRDTVQENTR